MGYHYKVSAHKIMGYTSQYIVDLNQQKNVCFPYIPNSKSSSAIQEISACDPDDAYNRGHRFALLKPKVSS